MSSTIAFLETGVRVGGGRTWPSVLVKKRLYNNTVENIQAWTLRVGSEWMGSDVGTEEYVFSMHALELVCDH